MFLDSNQLNLIKISFKKYPVLKAYVFGSYARGEANDKSDIDLIVELDYSKLKSGLEFVGLKIDLEEKLDKKVDLLTTKSISKYIAPFINAHKRLIYEC